VPKFNGHYAAATGFGAPHHRYRRAPSVARTPAATKVEEIQAQIVQTESTLKADQVQLGYTRIYAPTAGTIGSVDARQGQISNAAYSTPAPTRVADLANMTVWAHVSEVDIPQPHPDMKLYFTTLGFGGRRWEGTLRQILPAPPKPDTQTGATSNASAAQPRQPPAGNVVLYTALFDVTTPEGELRPEMTAQVFFITAAAKDAPTVPMALTPRDPGPGLYSAAQRRRSMKLRIEAGASWAD
jgi:macrolide-specific efflux system membrane fusion protein